MDILSREARGERFAMATPHALATEAGVAAFGEGGTAVDAALAAAAVLTVVYPHMCSLGGDLFALVAEPGGGGPGGRVTAVNASGASPGGVDVEALRALGEMPETGPLTVTVPGAVGGWEVVAGHGARLGLAAAVERAVPLAREGAPVARSLAAAIRELAPGLSEDPGMAEVFLPDGAALAEGATLRQPALAGTLEALASEGAAAFYRGEVGKRLARGLGDLGSPITADDLALYEPQVVRPLTGRYRDREVLTAPPNSQGFVLLQVLAALERSDVDPDAAGPVALALAELFRLTAADRDRWLGDPRRRPVPLDELLGEGHIEELAGRAREAMGDRSAAEGPEGSGVGEGTGPPASPRTSPSGDTVAVVAADAEGHAVSLIQSVFHSFGAWILEPATGIVCHNRGAAFSLEPGAPGSVEGGVRPPHTLTPVLVRDRGGVTVALGTMGGRAQPQILAEVLSLLLDQGHGPASAVTAPRWVVGGLGLGARSDAAFLEAGVAEAVERPLRGAGWQTVLLGERSEKVGHAQAVVASAGGIAAGTDPRADGAAAAR